MSSRPVHRSGRCAATYLSPSNERLRDVLTAGLLHAKPATIGSDADTGKQLRRSGRLTGPPEPPQPPVLENVEMDREGRVVYVDLEPRGEDRMLQALRHHLSAAQPTPHVLERLPLINRNRVLVEIEDRVALDLFQAWLLGSALKGPMGEALGNLFGPLDRRILLLKRADFDPPLTRVSLDLRDGSLHKLFKRCHF